MPRPAAAEVPLEVGDHADARPRAPDHRDDPARPAAVEPDRPACSGPRWPPRSRTGRGCRTGRRSTRRSAANRSGSGSSSPARFRAPSSLVPSTRSNDSGVLSRISLSWITPAPWIRPTGSPNRRRQSSSTRAEARRRRGRRPGRTRLARPAARIRSEVLAHLARPPQRLVGPLELGRRDRRGPTRRAARRARP